MSFYINVYELQDLKETTFLLWLTSKDIQYGLILVMSYLAHWWQIWWLILCVVAHQRYCTVAWLFLRCGYSSKTGIFKKVSIIWKISRNLMAAVLHSVKKVKFITKQNHYVKMKLKIYKDLRMVITKVMEMNNTTFPDNELFCQPGIQKRHFMGSLACWGPRNVFKYLLCWKHRRKSCGAPYKRLVNVWINFPTDGTTKSLILMCW